MGLESCSPLPQLPAAEAVTGDLHNTEYNGPVPGWLLRAATKYLFVSMLSALQVPGALQTQEAWGAWPYFELPAYRLEGATKKHRRSLAPLHCCSSVWGRTQLQCGMGTGHVHGTVATPWEHAVVQIRGKGGLRAP